MRRVPVVALVLALLAGFAAPVRAQEATPPPGAEVPPPAACTVAPVSAAELLAILATPGPAADATPAGGLPVPRGDLTVASEAEFPTGPPADPATTEAVAAVVRLFTACTNAGEAFRLLALVSDDLFRSFFCERAGPRTAEQAATITAEMATAMATPPVPAEHPFAILALRDARVLADGRVGIVAVLDMLGDEEGPTTTLFVLVDAGGRWLLDAAVMVEPADG